MVIHTLGYNSPAAASPEALNSRHLLTLWLCRCNAWYTRPGGPELLHLTGHQGQGLSQRCVAALNALVHLLHGRLAVLTAAGAAPEQEADLHLPDVLSLQTLHHGVHCLLHPELLQLCNGDSSRVGTNS